MRRIQIIIGEIKLIAELFDTETAHKIWQALPIKSKINTWGEEIYFPIPVSLSCEKDAREIVEKGELGYWPEGSAFCIFFGPTPISKTDEIRAASAVNIFGRIKEGDLSNLKRISSGEIIEVKQFVK